MLPADTLPPSIRNLKVLHARRTVGVDMLTITPRDLLGREYLVVIVNLALFNGACSSFRDWDMIPCAGYVGGHTGASHSWTSCRFKSNGVVLEISAFISYLLFSTMVTFQYFYLLLIVE
jgi:hypothetical protein